MAMSDDPKKCHIEINYIPQSPIDITHAISKSLGVEGNTQNTTVSETFQNHRSRSYRMTILGIIEKTKTATEQPLSENGLMVDDLRGNTSQSLSISRSSEGSTQCSSTSANIPLIPSQSSSSDPNGAPQRTVLQITPRSRKRGPNRMGPKDDMSVYNRAAKNIKVNPGVKSKYTPRNLNNKVQGTKTSKK